MDNKYKCNISLVFVTYLTYNVYNKYNKVEYSRIHIEYIN